MLPTFRFLPCFTIFTPQFWLLEKQKNSGKCWQFFKDFTWKYQFVNNVNQKKQNFLKKFPRKHWFFGLWSRKIPQKLQKFENFKYKANQSWVTGIWFLPCICSHVLLQTYCLRKRFVAVDTGVWFLSYMSSYVFL